MRREREREDDGDVYYQLLVRLYKGRRFPPADDQSGRSIAFEGRFNGEVLSTDPASLVPDPVFNTELVWEYGAVKQRALKASEGSTLKLRCVLAGAPPPHPRIPSPTNSSPPMQARLTELALNANFDRWQARSVARAPSSLDLSSSTCDLPQVQRPALS